jgi:hypothetical protein
MSPLLSFGSSMTAQLADKAKKPEGAGVVTAPMQWIASEWSAPPNYACADRT